MADMNPVTIYKEIAGVMECHKAVYRMVSTEHINQAKAEIQRLHTDGFLQDDFFQERLTKFRFTAPDNVSMAQSVLIVAVPQPILNLIFIWKGSEHEVTLPPTYDQQTDKIIMESLESILNPEGFHLYRASLPEKMLATHSGLMQYGRNNIGYIPGEGSFYRPVAFYTDLPCIEDQWESPVMMERCKRCKACIKACPTRAIGEDRFLLHAERCITFHNEHLMDIPDYVKPSMHHCLLGCMICQRVCPENRRVINRIEEREHFTEEETGAILAGVPYNKIPHSAQQKLDLLSLSEDYSLLARNLGFLF
jgi:epoxyqueuosine reductase